MSAMYGIQCHPSEAGLWYPGQDPRQGGHHDGSATTVTAPIAGPYRMIGISVKGNANRDFPG